MRVVETGEAEAEAPQTVVEAVPVVVSEERVETAEAENAPAPLLLTERVAPVTADAAKEDEAPEDDEAAKEEKQEKTLLPA